METRPDQVTLVPDESGQLTSDHGWDTIKEKDFLTDIIQIFSKYKIRTSLFVDPEIKFIEGAKEIGANRIELYTENYASNFSIDRDKAIAPYVIAAQKASEISLGINAGHDLNLDNLKKFASIPDLLEVSIGHAFTVDSLNMGMVSALRAYQACLS